MIQLSATTASYIENSNLGSNAQNAGAEDNNINELIDEKYSLTDKTRYMDANTEIAQSIKNVFESGVVGSTLDVQFKFKKEDGSFDKERNDLWEENFRLWSKAQFCTVGRKYHLRNIIAQIVKAEKSTEGEVLILHHFDGTKQWKQKNVSVKNKYGKVSHPSPFSYRIQLLETSMIDTSKDRDVKLNKSGKVDEFAVVGGLMIDSYDSVIGVYIYDDQSKSTSTFYEKDSFTLYFEPHLRISQYRGISRMSGIIGSVLDTMNYKNNELRTATESTKSKYVHKTGNVGALENTQQKQWEQYYKAKGIAYNFSEVQRNLGLDNSPVVYIGKDEEFDALTNSKNDSQYKEFVKTGNTILATNYGISRQTIVKGDADSVFAVVKAEKLENSIRFEIDQDNIKEMCIVHIVNNFIEAHAIEYGLKDFRLNKYKYLYKFEITMGNKTELDELKSANARIKNKDAKVIDDYQAAKELGNDLDQILENNTRSKTKQIQEIKKITSELKTLNEEVQDIGMKFKLNENLEIVLDTNYTGETDG